MSETAGSSATRPPRPPRRRVRPRFGLTLILSLVFLALSLAVAGLVLTGKPLRLPVWAVAEAEARLNRSLPMGPNSLSLGGVEVMMGRDLVPRLRLENLTLHRKEGTLLLRLPEARVTFDPAGLVQGRLRPATVVLSGASLRLGRNAEGRFDLDFGTGAGPRAIGRFPEALDRLDALFDSPDLAVLTEVQAEALSLVLEDARAGRRWQVGDGRMVLSRGPEGLVIETGLTLSNPGQAPARAELVIATRSADQGARLRATVDGVAARDIAGQAPALGFLSVLEAPISGALSAVVDSEGRIAGIEGGLSLGQGALQPSPETRPIAFDKAEIGLSFDPAAERISLTRLEVQSASLRLSAGGQVLVPGARQGRPEAFLAQIALDGVKVDPAGLFASPVSFDRGAIDLRLRLDPFRLDLGQLVLIDGDRRIHASGRAGADARGWNLAVDLALNSITHDRLLALWPLSAVPKTRAWLAENVQEGVLSDVKVALRAAPGQEPRFSLGYDFADGDVRFLKTLPPIRRGHGYATIEGNTYTMVLDRGQVTPPKGGAIAMGGSVFSVLDIQQKPAQAEIRLTTKSSLTAALSLLDEKPFGFLTKAGRSVDLGEGQAEVTALLRLPLIDHVRVDDVTYQVQGRLSAVQSDVLVPGKRLSAEQLRLGADRQGLEIAGKGRIGKLPFEMVYRLPFGAAAGGASRVEGQVELSPQTLAEFGIGLPDGLLGGKGRGRFVLDLPKGKPGQITMDSDLKGVTLAVPELGWRKAGGSAGRLSLAAQLGKPPVVERLELDAPGLKAEGRITIKPDGGLDQATFSRVEAGDWLRAAVTLSGRGKGQPPAVKVSGGRVDLRRLPETGRNAKGKGRTPVDLALDRVQVTEKIALTNVKGSFAVRGGFDGTFTAAINGSSPLRGTLVPTDAGTAIRLVSEDAGGVLAAAGIFSKARGGNLDLQLQPLGPRGQYRGLAKAQDFRVRDAPVLAALLNAISVVGLLEQFNGEGLLFSDADAEFRLTPGGIEVTRGAAIGASMGVSMAGTYDSKAERLSMQGVISPIYLLNGIGAILTRPGEGLFGFNYRIDGTADRARVSVNPLSILTPGMFREIFRRPAPKLEGQG